MYDDVIDLLKRHEYFRGISDGALEEIASFAKVTNYDAAEVVLQPSDPLTSVCFILRGRLKAVHLDSPEVADFDLSEFMRAKELFAIGEKAALVQIPKIQQLLARLDPVLFGSANNAVHSHQQPTFEEGGTARGRAGLLKTG